MKIKHQSLLLSLLCVSAFNPTHSLFAQGKLEPPGAPAPMFRTLEEVQPRRPIGTNTTPGDANALFKITQPGSYYLTTNITGVAGKDGIWINASGVTLDLMGFEVAGVSNSLNGIYIFSTNFSTLVNISVRNGSVRGWSRCGVNSDSFVSSVQYQELRLSQNGETGLASAGNSVIANCTAANNGINGISAYPGSTVIGCTANGNADSGITAESAVVTGCGVSQNVFSGILANNGSTVTGCVAQDNDGDGISVAGRCSITGNVCDGNRGAGIRTRSSGLNDSRYNRIEGNHVTFNGLGIYVQGFHNLIIRNTASINNTNYFIAATNKVGVIVAPPDSGAISGSTGGAGVGTTDPWANFSF